MKSLQIKLGYVLIALLVVVSLSSVKAQEQKNFFEMYVTVSGATNAGYAEYFGNYLEKIGIKLIPITVEEAKAEEIEMTATKSYHEDPDNGFDAGLWDLKIYPDPDPYLRFHSDNIPPDGAGNTVQFNNGKSDKLIQEARSETNITRRKELMWEWAALFMEEVPFVGIMIPESVYIARSDVQGLENFAVGSNYIDPFYCTAYLHITDGDTFNSALGFDPHPNYLPCYGWEYARAMLPTLLIHKPSFENTGDLAESWSISEDELTYTFNLRHDAVWQDDVPVTSADVKFTFEAIMNPDLGALYYGPFTDVIDSVETPDDYTVVLHLKKKFVGMLDLVSTTNPGNEIMPKHILENIPITDWKTSEWNTQKFVPGCGPYQWIEGRKGEYSKYERNDKWYGWGKMKEIQLQEASDAPKYILNKVILEKSTAYMALQTRELHWASDWYGWSDEYQSVSNSSDYVVATAALDHIVGFFLNLNYNPLGNKYVRQAISYALPREKFINDIMAGLATPTQLPFWKGHWARPANLVDPYPYDETKAKLMMEKAGYNYASLEPPATPLLPYVIGAGIGLAVGIVPMAAFMLIRKKK